VPMLAELIDAVVGIDTHHDTHQVEIALPNGAPIAVTTISNDTSGYAELLAWIVDHAPGPRLAVSIEGTRSYGVGLARAAATAGLIVLECEQPHRKAAGRASPTPSTRTWRCWPRCAWMPTGYPPHARTGTARRCGSR
jgi:Transposase